MDGYNGTIFAYGQTASGKTHTIFGDNNTEGIVHMALDTIFSKIAEVGLLAFSGWKICVTVTATLFEYLVIGLRNSYA